MSVPLWARSRARAYVSVSMSMTHFQGKWVRKKEKRKFYFPALNASRLGGVLVLYDNNTQTSGGAEVAWSMGPAEEYPAGPSVFTAVLQPANPLPSKAVTWHMYSAVSLSLRKYISSAKRDEQQMSVTFTQKLQIIMRIDWGKTQQTTPFLVEFVFLELYNTSSKGHSTGRRQNVLQSICISFVTCTQNWDWELLAFYPWRQRHFHDIKRKREKKAHIAVKQELDMVSKCVTL